MSTQKIYRSSYTPPQIPTNLSISQFLQTYNPDDVEGPKVICEDDWTGRKLTYAGIRESSAKGAFGLRKVMGLEDGDVVCICAPNSVDVVSLIHAVLWAGGTAVLINPLSTEYEMAHYLYVSKPKVVAGDATTWTALHGAATRQGFSQLKAISTDNGYCPFKDTTPLQKIFDQEEGLPPFDLSQRDSREHTAVVCFSSGTSGKAKGVEISHYNVVAQMLCIRATEPFYWAASIRGVFFAPLCHIYGLMTVALMGAWMGFYTMLQKKFTLESYLKLSVQTRANALRILPTIAVAMSKQDSFDLSRLSDVKYIMCTGASLPPPVIEKFRKCMPNAPIFQGYGMTETSITMLKPESAHITGSVGKLFAGMEARIVDDDGRDVAEGEQGEMLVRSPTVFRRYLRNEAATKDTFEGEWLKTGDVVRVDKNGYWWLTERKKELIKYKGNQVPPSELEVHLTSHPLVSEGAVCALWNEDQGTEIPVAYVSLTAEAKASKRDTKSILKSIQEHVDSRVAPYKRLRGGVEILDEIPKSGNGKILRRLLPARLAQDRTSKL